MANCPVCGSRIRDWAPSCPSCGVALEWDQAPTKQTWADEAYDYDDYEEGRHYDDRYNPQRGRRYYPQGLRRNRSMWLIIGGLIATLFACVCVCCFGLVVVEILLSEGESPTVAKTISSSGTASVGQRVETGGIALTVLNAFKANRIGYQDPDAGNVFLVIEVVIENVDRDEAPYNPLYFSVKDSDGFEYNTTITAPDPDLKSGTLTRGGRVRGFIAFEVRDIAKGFVMTYEPLVLLGGYKPIRIDLGQ